MKHFGDKPANITADAGYGSEENYQWLEKKWIMAYVKHNYFDRDQNQTLRNKRPYTVDKLTYNPDRDLYFCSSGQPMKKIGTYKSTTRTGYKQTIGSYQAENCEGCH